QGTPGGSGLTITTYDLGFCLTGQWVERFGACCDELTGNCVNNVAEANCQGANQRFAADTLCANMDPPCEPPTMGACCLDGTCIGDFIEVECVSMAGGWFEGESCYASPPFECPGPPGCPPDSLFAQNVSGTTEWQTAYTCTSLYDYYAYEDFVVSGEICDIHFFGLELTWDGGWFGCDDPDITFDIIFYPDVAGQPDLANPACVYMNVPPTTRTTYNDQLYNGNPLRGYAFTLSPCCVLYSGWVSVYDADGNTCVFLWMDSREGDNNFWRDTTGTLVATANNLNLCLTGEPVEVYGACCDDATGICTDNVLMQACVGPTMRFAALPVTCATLTPPCGEAVGACCFEDYFDCVVVTSTECATLGGTWLGSGTNCSMCPCILYCLPGMTPEGEPVCSDGYIDTYNGGCNSDPAVFQTITACDMVLCGTTGTFDGGSRDTDWYELTVTGPGTLYWLMVPGWDDVQGLIFILEPGTPDPCNDLIQIGYDTAAGCELAQVTHTVPIGEHTYWLWAGPADFAGVPCGSIYYAWADFECASGACCFGEECVELTWAECVVNGGEWNGAPSCDPNPCGVQCDYRGDSNCDGSINSYDIDGFIAAVSGEANWIAYHGGSPPCDYLCANDVNCDGAVNSYDIDWFITAVGNGVADPCP
ncbi:MAG: dockerin type I domain-containing protein, partial [Planctomycetota bacterium]